MAARCAGSPFNSLFTRTKRGILWIAIFLIGHCRRFYLPCNGRSLPRGIALPAIFILNAQFLKFPCKNRTFFFQYHTFSLYDPNDHDDDLPFPPSYDCIHPSK